MRLYVTPHEQNLIAWGGVLVQAAIYGLAIALFPVLPAEHPVQAPRLIFQEINLAMLVINLIPMHPLDGARAWYVVPVILRRIATPPSLSLDGGVRHGSGSRRPTPLISK